MYLSRQEKQNNLIAPKSDKTKYKDKNMNYDYIVLLAPTSPLREDSDIDNILKKLDDSKVNYDAIVSVGEIGEHPSIVKKIINQKIEQF